MHADSARDHKSQSGFLLRGRSEFALGIPSAR